MKNLSVPDYVANNFGETQSEFVSVSVNRVFQLIDEALKNSNATDWVVGDMVFHSKVVNEPYGIEYLENNFIIYGEQRGVKSALAIFHSPDLAAEYFVWLVTKGSRKINWDVF